MSTEDLDIPIYLTGFMATGKTHVGRLLARHLQRDFIDTDDMISERSGGGGGDGTPGGVCEGDSS